MKLGSGVFIFSIVWTFFACPLGTADDQTKPDSDLKSKYFVEDDTEKMVQIVYTGTDHIVQCYSYGDRLAINETLKNIPKEEVQVVNSTIIDYLLDQCVNGKWNNSQLDANSANITYSRYFIYPGTLWCGAGNISLGYFDLGPEIEADTCCRDHDNCKDNINGFETKHNLTNNYPFTRSNCTCDDDFYKCLQKANTATSNGVGQLYFNILETSCFKLEHRIKNCKRYVGYYFPTCQEYELDMNQPLEWQFFDAKEYKPLPSNNS